VHSRNQRGFAMKSEIHLRLAGVFTVLFILLLAAYSFEPDGDEITTQILAEHQELIDVHLNKDADFATRNLSDDFISVGNGEIRRPSKEELKASFSSYLESTKFTEYGDLQETIIGYSQDGSVAWSIVQVRLAGRLTSEGGSFRSFNDT